MSEARGLHVYELGLVPYRDAWALQRRLAERRKAGEIEDTLLLLEHPPVVTLGRDGSRASLIGDAATFAAAGVELVESDRGGDATYHGPGQLIAYPILDLKPDWKDIRRYVAGLEEVMIRLLADFGLQGGRRPGAPGVWLEGPPRKLGAIGARLSRWVTHHGFALNLQPTLSHFELIVPCGLAGLAVSSVAEELGQTVELALVGRRAAHYLAEHFGRVAHFCGDSPEPHWGDTRRGESDE